jgi:hypothetical protein
MTVEIDPKLDFPRRPRGRQTADAEAAYYAKLQTWCDGIRQLQSRLDFRVGTRGWCYLLEAYGLAKGDFDVAEQLISECRKGGLLPLTICAEDGSREFDGAEHIDAYAPEDQAAAYIRGLQNVWRSYTPLSFWDDQPYYLEVLVEKEDLKSLFAPVCHRYHIMYGNAKGWTDLNQRAAMMRRFHAATTRGQRPVLLYCGDHDPSGLAISDTLLLNFAQLAFAVERTYRIKFDYNTLIIDRFGLNRDFIDAHGLTWIDGLKTGSGKDLADPSHKDHGKAYVQDYIRAHGLRKVEANALVVAPEAGRQLLRDTIHKYIAPDALDRYEERLKAPREALRVEMLSRLGELGQTGDSDDE